MRRVAVLTTLAALALTSVSVNEAQAWGRGRCRIFRSHCCEPCRVSCCMPCETVVCCFEFYDPVWIRVECDRMNKTNTLYKKVVLGGSICPGSLLQVTQEEGWALSELPPLGAAGTYKWNDGGAGGAWVRTMDPIGSSYGLWYV